PAGSPAPATPAQVPRELDYSEPIKTPNPQDAATVDEQIVKLGQQTFDRARDEFKKGEYVAAQGDVEKSIRLVPQDRALHEVRALCQFAQKKYLDSAGTLYAVLNNGPGSDWQTIGSFYPDQDTYVKHLRSLEDSIREGGNEPWRHFLLAYHYMVLDEKEAALEEFRLATKLNEKDMVSKKMVEVLEATLGIKDPTKSAPEQPKEKAPE
ncbi:MAG: tetratricopeptide repeat protein, partial [Gemmataceae bacterium]